jgi:hypothetical protein
MKLRIAALALALAFVAAPALAALTETCPPCAEASDAGPCTSLAAVSCCGAAAPVAAAKTLLDAPTWHVVPAAGPAAPAPASALAPRVAHELAASTSPLRLSVVRRL